MADSNETQDNYRNEIEHALKVDTQRLGDVFRARDEHGDYDHQKIANDLQIGTPGPVYSTVGSIQTLLECEILTRGTTLAAQRARMLRNFSKRHTDLLSEYTREKLQKLAVEHDQVAVNENVIVQENEELVQSESSEIPVGLPGIYIYTLPHYLKYPVVPTDDDDTNPRTYLKIGRSETDMAKRVKDQNTTAIPEPPVILRMYKCPKEEVAKVENKIHGHLNAADHNPNRKTGAGKEWFLTHLRFVDSTADLLSLELVYSHPDY